MKLSLRSCHIDLPTQLNSTQSTELVREAETSLHNYVLGLQLDFPLYNLTVTLDRLMRHTPILGLGNSGPLT